MQKKSFFIPAAENTKIVKSREKSADDMNLFGALSRNREQEMIHQVVWGEKGLRNWYD